MFKNCSKDASNYSANVLVVNSFDSIVIQILPAVHLQHLDVSTEPLGPRGEHLKEGPLVYMFHSRVV